MESRVQTNNPILNTHMHDCVYIKKGLNSKRKTRRSSVHNRSSSIRQNNCIVGVTNVALSDFVDDLMLTEVLLTKITPLKEKVVIIEAGDAMEE